MNDECEDDCGCAACDTRVMSPPDGCTPVVLAAGARLGRCGFCRKVKDVHHRNWLGIDFCRDCSTVRDK